MSASLPQLLLLLLAFATATCLASWSFAHHDKLQSPLAWECIPPASTTNTLCYCVISNTDVMKASRDAGAVTALNWRDGSCSFVFTFVHKLAIGGAGLMHVLSS